jgi:hypothetical protein
LGIYFWKFELVVGFSKCTQTRYYIVPRLASISDLKNVDSFCGT